MITYMLSGPMRNIPHYNYPTFFGVETALTSYLTADGAVSHEEGWVILNPARSFDGETHHPIVKYMKQSLDMAIKADVIVLLPGWRVSEGAFAEINVGLATGSKFWAAIPNIATDEGWEFQPIDVRDELDKLSVPTETLVMDTPASSPRADMLDEARKLITGDRNNSYGPPTQDFQKSAEAATAYGYRGPGGREIVPHDIAILVMLVKLSRLTWTPGKRDHWVDIAGYAGCGYECTVEEERGLF